MKIYEQLNYIQTNLNAPKNQFNKFGGYPYRSCEDILEGLKPLLKETGCCLVITDEPVLMQDRFYIRARVVLRNKEGEGVESKALAREPLSRKGMDEAQITGGTSSYARKNALCGLFCIDDNKDPDATNTGEDKGTKVSEGQKLKELLTQAVKCESEKELTVLWKANEVFQQYEDFRKAVADRAKVLKGQ